MAHLVEIVDDVLFDCPLIEDKIYEEDCFDINMVRIRVLKRDVLNDLGFEVDMKKARKVCPKCKHNPMTEDDEE